jgi:hypothetical protein
VSLTTNTKERWLDASLLSYLIFFPTIVLSLSTGYISIVYADADRSGRSSNETATISMDDNQRNSGVSDDTPFYLVVVATTFVSIAIPALEFAWISEMEMPAAIEVYGRVRHKARNTLCAIASSGIVGMILYFICTGFLACTVFFLTICSLAFTCAVVFSSLETIDKKWMLRRRRLVLFGICVMLYIPADIIRLLLETSGDDSREYYVRCVVYTYVTCLVPLEISIHASVAIVVTWLEKRTRTAEEYESL